MFHSFEYFEIIASSYVLGHCVIILKILCFLLMFLFLDNISFLIFNDWVYDSSPESSSS